MSDQVGFFEGKDPITASFLIGQSPDTNGGSWSSTQSIGAADADRWVYLAWNASSNFDTVTISSVTCDGSAMTEVAYKKQDVGGNSYYAGIHKILKPTGTSATFSVNVSGGTGLSRGCLFSTYRLISSTGFSEATDTDGGSTGTEYTMTTAGRPWGWTIVSMISYRTLGAPSITFDVLDRDVHLNPTTYYRHTSASRYGVGTSIATISSAPTASAIVGAAIYV